MRDSGRPEARPLAQPVRTRYSRRKLLRDSASALPLLILPACAPRLAPDPAAPSAEGRRLFTLGVASGDPLPDGIVLWTRLARHPLQGGGMGKAPVEVTWEIAADERLRNIVATGSITAAAELAHSVHVEVTGLAPGRWYWYRFRTAEEESPIGRTRTAPDRAARPEGLRFALASCQSYEGGYYTAHRHLAVEDLDLVVFVGDYIYEGRPDRDRPRLHLGGRAQSLDDYRNRYGLYKSDPDLQASHAAFPWVVAPDDHEVANNYAGDRDGSGTKGAPFLARRAAAYQAYYEHMPLRRASLPRGPDMLLHRRFDFGSLLQLNVLDTRQYRTAQPCADAWAPRCEDALRADATVLGRKQEEWLFAGLRQSRAKWNVLAQQVPLLQRARPEATGLQFSTDKWDGYVAARHRLLDALATIKPANPIVLSGDVHECWIGEVKADFDNRRSPTLGSEFVASSMSSGGDGRAITSLRKRIWDANSHLKYYNGLRGYLRCDVKPGAWRTDVRTVDYVSRPGAKIATAASFVVEAGAAGVHLA